MTTKNTTNTNDNTVSNTTINIDGDAKATIRTYVVSEPFNESFLKLLDDMVETMVIKSIMEFKTPDETLKEIDSTVDELAGNLKKRVTGLMLRKFKKMRDLGPMKIFELVKERMAEFGLNTDEPDEKPDNNDTATESGETENA